MMSYKIWWILPSIGNGDDSGSVLGNAEEDGLGEVEVEQGRVAAAAGRAEVSGGDGDYPREARLSVVHAPQLEARPAAQPVVEQCRAQRRCVRAVTRAVQIPIPTRTPCM